MVMMPPIRTITLGIADSHPLSAPVIAHAAGLRRRAEQRFIEAGYEVQTVRLSTRPLFDDLAFWSDAEVLHYVAQLQHWLDENTLAFCSLGPAQASRPDFPLERLKIVPELLIPHQALCAAIQVATVKDGLSSTAIQGTTSVIQRLARETEEGFGNFRFAMLACVPAGSPFFPAAYHEGVASITLGLQGASIIAQALQQRESEVWRPDQLTQRVREAVESAATPIVAIGQRLADELGLGFGGIDLSPAPLGEDSIVAALEQIGSGPFGSLGTLTLASALTDALKSTRLPTCGYCGLMLPILEDRQLGQRWAEGGIGVQQLLLYSAVCGTGLDTIPLSGEVPAITVTQLLYDVATLALRLRKPLSARLFPVPGKRSGEPTAFSSQYLTNTLIRDIF